MLNRKIAALERTFAGPFKVLQNKQVELTRILHFMLAYLLVNGHIQASALDDLRGPHFWRRVNLLVNRLQGHPGLLDARRHLPKTAEAWQAWEENPEEYFRICAEREQAGA